MKYQQLFELKAKQVKEDWRHLDKNELCQLYVDHLDKQDADNYLSAIILRYWASIYYYRRYNPSYPIEDYIDWYLEAIHDAFTYCLKKKKENVELNTIVYKRIDNIMQKHFYLNNMQKRKLNFSTASLDAYLDGFNEPLMNFAVDIEPKKLGGGDSVVQSFINMKNTKAMQNAIIIDLILTNDYPSKNGFNKSSLATDLLNLSNEYVEDFAIRYENVDKEVVLKAIENFKSMTYHRNRTKLNTYIDSLLKRCAMNKEIIDLLC